VEVNDRACEHYGYSREEFLNLEIFDLEIEPPLREQVRALYDNTPVGKDVEV
jgi:PAS domain S-box-containing protein